MQILGKFELSRRMSPSNPIHYEPIYDFSATIFHLILRWEEKEKEKSQAKNQRKSSRLQ